MSQYLREHLTDFCEFTMMESSPSQEMTREDLDSESQDNYAFLNHSAATIYHNLAPSVDDKPLARQKRKRTSPEDQAVLEAAYKRDPKPDKTARLEIVEQVALGEKEVQIWFQNRRQSSRRKSRPLLPHEIAKYSFARSEALENGLLPSQAFSTEFGSSSSPSTETLHIWTAQPGTTPSRAQLLSESRQMSTGRLLKSPSDRSRNLDQVTSSPTPGQGGGAMMTSHTVTTVEPDAKHRAMAPSEAPATTHPCPDSDPIDPQAMLGDGPRSRLKKASSFVRLAMTADGNAQVTTKDASSPSPPRPSQSSTWSDPSSVSSFSRKLSRTASGRSRDSRSWEFWCDKDARSELEFKAVRDASGSAAGAISLMRSASGRSVLGSLPSKRNTVFSRQMSSTKRPRLSTDTPAFHRSCTSQGRLQSKPHRSNALSLPKLNHSRSAATIWIPGNDSDKENWSPGCEESTECKPRMPADEGDGSQGKGTSDISRKAASSIHRRKSGPREASRPLRHGDVDPEDDAELAAFMRTDLHSSSPSVEDDLDCVQGLLSLSQGNWR